MAEPGIWSVFNDEERLVLIISDEPGSLSYARVPDGDVEVVRCAFATLQCLDPEIEHRLLDLLSRARHIEALFEGLRKAKLRIRPGRPVIGEIARL